MAREWGTRLRENRFFGNVFIRSLGTFMLLCSVFSISRQYVIVSTDVNGGGRGSIRSIDARDAMALAAQAAAGLESDILDIEPVAENWSTVTASSSSSSVDASVSLELGADTIPKPTEMPTISASPTPTAMSTEKPEKIEKVTEKPTEKPAEKVEDNSTDKPTEKPVDKPADKPTEKATEKPTEKPAEKATDKPAENTEEKPTEQPIVKPKRLPEPRQAVKKDSKGILMCLHDGILELGISLIRELRCLGNNDPIEVHHCHDLTRPSVDLLFGLDDNIQVVDLCERYVMKKVFSDEMAKTFQSYWIKPLAVHYTSFEELIFLDADAVLLKDPAALRTNEGYKKHGTVFFYDRVINNNQYLNKRKTNAKGNLEGPIYLHQWLKEFDYKRFKLEYAEPSPTFKNSFAYRGKTAHEQDSSMLLINKRDAEKAMNVLWYLITEHRFIYEFSWGDKEAFWLSYEFSHTPYFFSPWGASVVSTTPNEDMERHPDTLCGSLAHFDPTLDASAPAELLYVNGRSLVDPVPFRLHKLKLLQPNLVFNMLPTHMTPRQERRAPSGKGEWPECMTGMGSSPVPPQLLPYLYRRRQHFQAISMGFIEPLLDCSNPGERLPEHQRK